MLIEGITLLSRKVLDLMEICLGHGLQLDFVKTYTHMTHEEWSDKVLDLYMQLIKSEQKSKRHFSSAF